VAAKFTQRAYPKLLSPPRDPNESEAATKRAGGSKCRNFSDVAEKLLLTRFCQKLGPLILRYLGTAGFCGSGIFTLEPNLCNTSPKGATQQIIKGVVIIAAVLIEILREKKGKFQQQLADP